MELLPGGLTNVNCKVTTPHGVYVARLSVPGTELLAIDRAAERANTASAAAAGVAPDVVDYVPGAGLLVVEWVRGRTLTATDLREERVLRQLAATCARLHAGPRFATDFDMSGVQRRYLSTATRLGFRLPDGYTDLLPQWAKLQSVLALHPPQPVPCHNDLLAANIIDDGDQLWLIDFEYSGNNDPCFELGNIWSESNLPEEQLDVLITSYFGRPDPVATARARLQALASAYGWTLWGVIQHATSTFPFDFWSWSLEKYERAVATFTSTRFSDLLGTVASAPPVAPGPDFTSAPIETARRSAAASQPD